MIKLENIHQEMNDKQVQQAADLLYQEWMYKELDGLERDASELRMWTTLMFKRIGVDPSEDQLLAAETLFQSKVRDD